MTLSISRALHSYLLTEALFSSEQLVLWDWHCSPTSDEFPTVAGVLTLLDDGELKEQVLFTRQEQAVIRLLLDSAPMPCPYARLYAALTDMEEDEAGYLLDGALHAEVFHLLLQPLRQVIVQCRVKLARFALDIRDVPGGPLGDRLACGLFPLWNRDGFIEPTQPEREAVSRHEATHEQQTEIREHTESEQEV